MKILLKNLGLILIIIGATILITCALTNRVNNNAVLGGAFAIMVTGLISYIWLNKRIIN